MARPLIVFTSDYGLYDSYVGIMKGVILKLSPQAEIIDLTNEIQPQNIKQAAFVLHTAVPYFPEGTIFLTIVDPGVGTDRKAIAFKGGNQIFIAPDNGLLSYIINDVPFNGIFSLTNEKFHLNSVSQTFHGRDIFAPVAAHIANGVNLNEMGQRISPDTLVKLPNPQCFHDAQGMWHGEILHIDRFGDIITSLKAETLGILNLNTKKRDTAWAVETSGIKINNLSSTFGDVKSHQFVAYIGSSGYIEIGFRDGNAAKQAEIEIGQNVYAYKKDVSC